MGWTPTPTYWIGPPPREHRGLTTSPTELVHVAVAFLVLSVDIALVSGFLRFGVLAGAVGVNLFLAGLGFAFVAALTGFVAHEMAHKVAAQRYGFWAEFRMSPLGLLLSLVTAYAGFLFAAPGATVVSGMGDSREWGRTSLAGPALNLVEGLAFFGGSVLAWWSSHFSGVWQFLVLLAFINGWFAAFNLIPLGPLDGRKVLRWSLPVWATSFAVAAAFTAVMYLVLIGTLPPG
ncbi:MAG TPA: site-2 protease family protein [Thermoplasmata archaeon]|nr:site-2 protease family protein [Thermoplasmata archaeon]